MKITNTIMATLICALVSGAHIFYISSTVFMEQFSTTEQQFGRFEAFMYASDIMEGFWFHVLKGWVSGFGISLLSCLLLLVWLQHKALNR